MEIPSPRKARPVVHATSRFETSVHFATLCVIKWGGVFEHSILKDLDLSSNLSAKAVDIESDE